MKLINNFCDSNPIEIIATNDKSGQLVNIIQYSAGMRFQHSIRTDQAREMAAVLVALADSFDEVVA